MAGFAAFILISLTLLVGAVVLYQAARGTVDLLSTRNLFLAGLIVFQMTGPATQIISGVPAEYEPGDWDTASMIFTTMLILFLLFFQASYSWTTRIVDKLFERKALGRTRYSNVGLFFIGGAIVGFGVLCQFVLVYVPVLGPGFHALGFGMFAIGSGLASWVWFKHFYNPIYGGIAIFMILLCLGLTFNQNFGRRPLVGIIMVVGWAGYFSHWRNNGFRFILTRGLLIGGAGFVLLALVTSTREGGFRERSAMENVNAIASGSFGKGAALVLAGQEAGSNSMWIIESRPESMPYDTLHSLKLAIGYPIPRSIWPDKPEALSMTIPQQEKKIQNVAKDINIGPGIIGHIENDNPWIALWLYPVLIGFYLRFLDRVVAWFPDNPFLVLPIGSALGQIIAMPRGELASFFFLSVINIMGSLVIMLAISYALSVIGLISKEPPPEEDWSYDDATDDDNADSASWYTDGYEDQRA